MIHKLLHTPEGVRDIYNQECTKKLILQENLQRLLKQYGFCAIETPTFEYFDIFSQEIGTTPSKDLYKFFDREGNTLVLRPDITPSVARSVTKYFSDETMPVRLWYQGSTFINNSSYQGRLKESTQLGAELIGDDTVDADAEILALVVNLLKTAGLKEFQLTVGHASFLRELVEAAGLKEEEAEELKMLISNKNFFGVEELVESLSIPRELELLFQTLGTLYTDAKPLEEVKELAQAYPGILSALNRLTEIYGVLKLYGVDNHVSLELGVLSSYRYYTGIIFAGYTFGSGEAVVKGGRYDDLLPYFGKESPSIGFAVVIDQLLAALSRQKIDVLVEENCRLLVYRNPRRSEAIEKAGKLREQGEEIMLLLWDESKTREAYLDYAGRQHLTDVIFLD